VGVGLYPDFNVAVDLNAAGSFIEPDVRNRVEYERLYGIFNAAYEALVPVYAALAQNGAQVS
jgi:sugar (pentulose or hexulose) kinase